MQELIERLGPTPRALLFGVVIVLLIGGVASFFLPETEEQKDARLKAQYTATYTAQAAEARSKEYEQPCEDWDREPHVLGVVLKRQLEALEVQDFGKFMASEFPRESTPGDLWRNVTVRYTVADSPGVRVPAEAVVLIHSQTCRKLLVRTR